MDDGDFDFKRDKRFVYRMALLLGIGLLGGVFILLKLTDPTVGGCAAEAFQSVTVESQ